MLIDQQLSQANQQIFRTLAAARPRLLGLAAAKDAVPGMHSHLVLHAGPPLAWDEMPGAMRAAIDGALVFEGLAPDLESARTLAASGRIDYGSAHDHQAAGAMAGIITASMPVFIAEDEDTGMRAYTTINEGLGKALRFGANTPEVIARLVWMRDRFAPLLDRAIREKGGLDLKAIVAESLRRGDECHNRNKAATSQFFREIAPSLVSTGAPHEALVAAMRFIAENDHFFLSLSIAHAKVASLLMERRGGGSVVTVMAGNGAEVGIRVSGAPGRWFTTGASVADVKLFPGHDLDEATPTMGDSYVTEVIGLGAFALAAAPAIASFIGGTVHELNERSERMRRITVAEHPDFLVPSLDFRGVPCCIDVRKVIESGITPLINTGVASSIPGVGQIGAGTQSLPIACFASAYEWLGAQEPPCERA